MPGTISQGATPLAPFHIPHHATPHYNGLVIDGGIGVPDDPGRLEWPFVSLALGSIRGNLGGRKAAARPATICNEQPPWPRLAHSDPARLTGLRISVSMPLQHAMLSMSVVDCRVKRLGSEN